MNDVARLASTSRTGVKITTLTSSAVVLMALAGVNNAAQVAREAETKMGIEIRQTERDGKTILELENCLIKVVLAPEIARLPLSLIYKPTGREMFLHPTPLSAPNQTNKHVYFGGVIDCVPWVSQFIGTGTNVQFVGPEKGLLYRTHWDWTTGRNGTSAWYAGAATITYADPITGKPATLAVKKIVTAYRDSAQLQMDYTLKNTGTTDAGFTFDIHSRTAFKQEGDYFHAPGDTCFLYELVNMPALEKRGCKVDTWIDWPIPEITELTLTKDVSYCFVYLPADWCVVGDDQTRESLFFVSSPIRIGQRTTPMKMGIFRTNATYVPQPCLSYALQAHTDRWKKPGETAVLKPGEESAFTLSLAVYQGIAKTEMPALAAVQPEWIAVNELKLSGDKDKMKIEGKLALSAYGKLTLKQGEAVLKEMEVPPGLFDLSRLESVAIRPDQPAVLYFESAAGRQPVRTFYPPGTQPAAWKPYWEFRRKLAIDHTRVGQADLADFPVLIALQDDRLKTAAHGGQVAQAGGGDILFTAADGVTKLPHEIESYDGAAGALQAWVNVPVLSHTADTDLYLYYGNADCGPQAQPGKVWKADQQTAVHFQNAGEIAVEPNGKIGGAGIFDGQKTFLTIPAADVPALAKQLTVEAWINTAHPQAERIQAIVSQWAPLESFNTFDAYDAGKTSGLDTTGFLGAVFDGRYVYFSPQHDTRRRHGKVLRYDTHGRFDDPKSWTGYDAEKTSGLNTKGFYGAAFDGAYVYFVPRTDGQEYHTRALRYDTRQEFTSSSAWEAFDAGLGISHQGGGFDGRYVYFAPGAGNKGVAGDKIRMIRYDTQAAFTNRASWSTFDANRIAGLETADYDGVAFDGRYVYFVPIRTGAVLRYDTTQPFAETNSWRAYNAAPLKMKMCVGSVFDGAYLYFVAYDNYAIVRYNTRLPFEKDASWSAYDVRQTAGISPFGFGYDGGFYDGRFVYFVPFYAADDNKKMNFHGVMIRYDTCKDFGDPKSWQVTDAGKTSGLKTIGYNAGAYDGRYFYCAPWHDGEAYQAASKIVGHGRVLRYDTIGRNGTFILKAVDYGHNGGLSGAVIGPSFTVNTEKGSVTARSSTLLAPGWHHVAGVYDGQAIRLYVDGILANERTTPGGAIIQAPAMPVTVGRISGGDGYFQGLLDGVRMANVARSPDWIRAAYENQNAPTAFIIAGPEESTKK